MNLLTKEIRVVRRTRCAGADYAVRMAVDAAEVRAAQALRFAVFNLELEEGLERSYATGLDADPFDPVCDHLIVEHRPTGCVVGTYRLQTGATAAARLGYYSEREFDFGPFERIRGELIELGRACVHADHRNLSVLTLLWKGIADYAWQRGGRYLCGCSSISGVDPAVGATAYAQVCRQHLAPAEFRTAPHLEMACDLRNLTPEPVGIPKLLRAYLGVGAWICGPPAVDREFGTIDFLTLLNLERLEPELRSRLRQ